MVSGEPGDVATGKGRPSDKWKPLLLLAVVLAVIVLARLLGFGQQLGTLKDWIDVDRALTDGEEHGFFKIHIKRGSDKILGATVVGRHASEMLGEISLAMVAGLGLGRISDVIRPYPTQAEAIRRAADAYRRSRLTPRVKKWLERWFAWTR